MKNKNKIIIELIKYFFVMAVLLLITLGAMELPRYYFYQSDEKLFTQVNDIEYTINVVNEEMNMKQKIEALRDEKSIISESNVDYTDELTNKYTNMLINEIKEMLDGGWQRFITEELADSTVEKQWGALKVVKVINNGIYSYELGTLLFKNTAASKSKASMYSPAMILFDTSTGKIMYMSMYVDNGIDDAYDVYYSDAVENLYSDDYSDSETNNNAETVENSYIKALSDYYDMDIKAETADAFISRTGMWASPFTVHETGNSNFDTIYNYLYTKFEDMY